MFSGQTLPRDAGMDPPRTPGWTAAVMIDEGPVVVPEVRPFKERDLTLGLPHTFAISIIAAWAMLFFYFEYWITSFVFLGTFWMIGKAGVRYEPYWWEILQRLPFTPRVIAP